MLHITKRFEVKRCIKFLANNELNEHTGKAKICCEAFCFVVENARMWCTEVSRGDALFWYKFSRNFIIFDTKYR